MLTCTPKISKLWISSTVEWKQQGVTMVKPSGLTAYGCYEFIFEDIDGRRIGIGRIKNDNMFSGA
jgi:hypothetical protein